MNKELKSIRINAVSENRMDQLKDFHYDQLKLYSVAKMVHSMALGNLDIHVSKSCTLSLYYTMDGGESAVS